MKKFYVLIGIIAIALYGYYRIEGGQKPSIAEVEPALKAYLETEASGSGSATVSQLSVTRVGDFVKEIGGWPVYGSYTMTTEQYSQIQGAPAVTTASQSVDPNDNSAIGFVRRTATGAVECFMPELFQNAEKEMNSAMQKAVDNIQIKQ